MYKGQRLLVRTVDCDGTVNPIAHDEHRDLTEKLQLQQQSKGDTR